jgi:catalase
VVVSTHRDGAMRFDENGGRRGNYQPSRHGGPVPDAGAEPPPSPSSGAIGRYPHNADDHYEQPRALYHLMTNGERERLVANIIWSLGKAHAQTQRRQILLFERVDAELGRRIGNVLDVHAEAAE